MSRESTPVGRIEFVPGNHTYYLDQLLERYATFDPGKSSRFVKTIPEDDISREALSSLLKQVPKEVESAFRFSVIVGTVFGDTIRLEASQTPNITEPYIMDSPNSPDSRSTLFPHSGPSLAATVRHAALRDLVLTTHEIVDKRRKPGLGLRYPDGFVTVGIGFHGSPNNLESYRNILRPDIPVHPLPSRQDYTHGYDIKEALRLRVLAGIRNSFKRV